MSPVGDDGGSLELTRTIYLDRIRNNLSAYGGKVMLMVKADAYGHGAIEVAKSLSNRVDYYGVATVEEGRKLRENGVKTPILSVDVLPFEYGPAKAHDLAVSVGDIKSLETLSGIDAKDRPKIHLKLNTGMNRFGFGREEFDTALRLAKSGGIEVEGVCTHLYAPNETQLDLFDREVEIARTFYPDVIAHACSTSSAHLNRYDMVRIGVGAYENSCKVESVVLNSVRVRRGDRIGYGDNFAPKDGYAIWLLGGYSDGIVKSQPVLIDGAVLHAVSVCMDVFAVLSDVPYNKGERAVLIGDGLTESIVAKDMNRTVYEVMTALKGRVKNVYEESGSQKNRKSEFI